MFIVPNHHIESGSKTNSSLLKCYAYRQVIWRIYFVIVANGKTMIFEYLLVNPSERNDFYQNSPEFLNEMNYNVSDATIGGES
jgi:hypothetical protein